VGIGQLKSTSSPCG